MHLLCQCVLAALPVGQRTKRYATSLEGYQSLFLVPFCGHFLNVVDQALDLLMVTSESHGQLSSQKINPYWEDFQVCYSIHPQCRGKYLKLTSANALQEVVRGNLALVKKSMPYLRCKSSVMKFDCHPLVISIFERCISLLIKKSMLYLRCKSSVMKFDCHP